MARCSSRRSHRASQRWLFGLVLLILCAGEALALQDPPVTPLTRAHAHNDYLHPRPLHDALELGYLSVEVDIHLVDDELLVAHDPEELDPERTLQSLYLDPLREQIRANGGVVYPDSPPLLLLIDIKTGAETTYARLHPLLRQYADILTFTAGNVQVEGPVLAVISGDRPRSAMLAAPLRFAAFDGRLDDLDRPGELTPSFMPLVSANWSDVTDWDGEGEPPEGFGEQLQSLADRAHKQGRRLRFWGAPDRPEVWSLLHASGVDLINTDDLSGLRDFLLASMEEAK